jgi:hypothetical protein
LNDLPKIKRLKFHKVPQKYLVADVPSGERQFPAAAAVWAAVNGVPARVQQLVRSPVTSTPAPVSAAAEDQDDQDDYQNQFHGKPPL